MIHILFVCYGNICRSPMAEFILKDLVEKAGLADRFFIQSAATSTDEIGNPVYPPARRKLAEHGIRCAGKTARQLTRGDYERFDLLLAMDRGNLRSMNRLFGGDPAGKIHLLLEYAGGRKGSPRESGEAGRAGSGEAAEKSGLKMNWPRGPREGSRGHCFDEVADPWYTGDFETTWRDVLAGCQGLLKELAETDPRLEH